MLMKYLPGLWCGGEHQLKKSVRRQRPKLAPEVRMITSAFIIPVTNVKSKGNCAGEAQEMPPSGAAALIYAAQAPDGQILYQTNFERRTSLYSSH